MFCSMCDNKKRLKEEKATHNYKSCGLNNVTLIGVTYSKCDKCGEEYYGYGDMEKLHRTIAHALVQKKSTLAADEMRFLRKYLGYSAVDFAEDLLGISPEHLSRIENSKEAVSSVIDRLIRSLVTNKDPHRDYDALALLTHREMDFKRIILKPNKQGSWILQEAA